MVQDDTTINPSKTGPKPKTLEPFEKLGIAVGRSRTHIDPVDVQKLAALGATNREIANFFGVDDSTIAYNFKSELTRGRADLSISLRRAMLHNATQNMNATIQIWLSKNMLGMQDAPTQSEDARPLPWVERTQPKQTTAQIGKTSSLQVMI